MKALIQKELRENLKVAALGFALFVLLLVEEYYRHSFFMKNLVRGAPRDENGPLQPLRAATLLTVMGILWPILAAVLGWLQMHNERHHDLWSFLVHRPLTRTKIFLGKTTAGLGLYLFAAGLPLVVFILWAALPGHVAAPFEWGLLAPIAALFLAGPVYYFAGMLVAGRQARWYASRVLPLATGLLLSVATFAVPHFWQALLLLTAGCGILGIAAWGNFNNNGVFNGQPPPAKAALGVTLALGAQAAIYAAISLSSAFLPDWYSGSWTSYRMASQGTIYKVTQSNNQPAEIVDLKGESLKDDKTGLPLNLEELNQSTNLNAPYFGFLLEFGGRARPQSYFMQPASFDLWRDISGTLWYYWGLYGRLVVFDVKSCRAIGSLGPNGFSAGLTGDGSRFERPPPSYSQGRFSGGSLAEPLINTATTLYLVDFYQHSVNPVFSTPVEDPIGGVGTYLWEGVFVQATSLNTASAVATKHFVYLLGPTNKVESKIPYQAQSPAYNHLRLYRLTPEGHYALWLLPDPQAQHDSGGKLPIKVTWLTDGQATKTAEVPDLSFQRQKPNVGEAIMTLLTSPVIVAPLFSLQYDFGGMPLQTLWLSLAAAALLCFTIGAWFGYRYRFDLREQVGWAVFHLLFGVPGLLAFLSVHEWPAREPCPKCGRLRVVSRERCEHCGAPFPPPAETGTEIFELAATEH